MEIIETNERKMRTVAVRVLERLQSLAKGTEFAVTKGVGEGHLGIFLTSNGRTIATIHLRPPYISFRTQDAVRDKAHQFAELVECCLEEELKMDGFTTVRLVLT